MCILEIERALNNVVACQLWEPETPSAVVLGYCRMKQEPKVPAAVTPGLL